MENLINELKAVVTTCGKISPKKCERGECEYSTLDKWCVFEKMGMGSPYDWKLEEGERND